MDSSSTHELSATGLVMRAYFHSAWDDFTSGNFDKANEMALWLLRQPELGVFHSAGSHLILAHSPDCYVHHGREAVRFYKQLKEETPVQAENKAELVAYAEKVLEKAERDKAALDAKPLTEEEYDEHMNEFYKRQEEMEEAWKKFELEDLDDPEDEDDDEDDDQLVHDAPSSGEHLQAQGLESQGQDTQVLQGGETQTPQASQQSTFTDPIGEGLLDAEQEDFDGPGSEK